MLAIVAQINEFCLNLYLYMLNQYYYLNGSGADQVLIRIVPLVQSASNGSGNKRILAEFVPLYAKINTTILMVAGLTRF